MVDLSISGGNLVLHVRGADKLWALKSSLEIPLAHVAEIRADPAIITFRGTRVLRRLAKCRCGRGE
jgi:hypothetical protein